MAELYDHKGDDMYRWTYERFENVVSTLSSLMLYTRRSGACLVFSDRLLVVTERGERERGCGEGDVRHAADVLQRKLN